MAGSVSREQISRAKKIDLLTYIKKYEPDNLIRTSANEYRLKDHDSLKISHGRWHWFSHGNTGGASALDYLIKVRGIDFVTAVMTLCDCRAPPAFSSQQVNTPSVSPKSEFILPTPNWNNNRVIEYLHNKRGIDREIIDNCLQNATLYETKKYGNCCFVGRDKANTPRFACVRSTINNFRQDIKNSDKRYSFSITANDNSAKYIFVAESPIDILSIATLQKMRGTPYENYHYLALSGTSPLALEQYLLDYPKIECVILSLDNDSAGRSGTEKIKQTLKNRNISIIAEKSPTGNDFNDALIAILQKQKELIEKSRSNADIFI